MKSLYTEMEVYKRKDWFNKAKSTARKQAQKCKELKAIMKDFTKICPFQIPL